MNRKLLCLIIIFHLATTAIFAQIAFQEKVIDSTNGLSIGVNGVHTYSIHSLHSDDFDGDGDMDILPKASSLKWIENVDGQGTFGVEHVINSESQGIRELLISDIDGDGDKDIVVSVQNLETNEVSWYENIDGLGTFSTEQIIGTTPNIATTIHLGDIDADDDIDIFTASINNGVIMLYENINGQGEFGEAQLLATASFSSTTAYIGIVLIDFDDDNDNDILFFPRGSPDDNAYWLENTNGEGDFASAQIAFESTGWVYMNIADIDSDGDMDIYAQDSFASVYWYKNNGSGIFSFESSFDTSFDGFLGNGYVGLINFFDVDGDNDIDMLAFGRNEEDITNQGAILWFENLNGQGNFSEEQIISTVNFTDNWFRFNISDIDGDGFTDLLCSNLDGYEISWNRNEFDSEDTFGDSRNIVNDIKGINEAILSDLDSDGDKDIVLSSGTNDKIVWYENIDGQGTFGLQTIISSSQNGVESISCSDLDNDGNLDIVSASSLDDTIAWYRSIDGLGNFSEQLVVSTISDGVEFIKVVDLDGDSDLDIVALENYGDKVTWYENMDGQGNFGSQQIISIEVSNVNSFDVSDLDTDGDLDIIVNEPFSWIENIDGQGSFGAIQTLQSTDDVGILKVSDIDGDGDNDIVVEEYPKLGWYENTDGLGSFGAFQLILDNNNPSIILLSDIDNDEDDDVIVSLYQGTNQVEIVYFENYEGIFVGPKVIMEHGRISSLYADDIDEDGKTDILYSINAPQSFTKGEIGWFKNLGNLDNTISGSLIFDQDDNGCSQNDIPAGNILVGSSNNGTFFLTFSNNNGFFSFNVNEGEVYTQILDNLPDYFIANPLFHISTFDNINVNNDSANFCITSSYDANDINVVFYPLSEPRPGFNTSYKIIYNNLGTMTMNGNIEFTFDSSKMQYLASTLVPESQSENSLIFSFDNLLPFENQSIILDFNMFPPPTTNIGDVLELAVSVPIASDVTPENNLFELEQTVIGSYDPNDISVLEGEQILLEQADGYLHYMIRFQNTGNASAINVKVENIIDQNLNWATIQLENLSHNGYVEIIDGVEANFIFDNINLPSSDFNEPESHGYIMYKIKPNSPAEIGDIFYNTASIFFDYNPPIITNTVSTEIVQSLSINDYQEQTVHLFPNPASDILKVNSKTSIQEFIILDINGKEIKRFSEVSQSNNYELSLLNVKAGFYFLKMFSNGKVFINKFIKI